MVKVTKTYVPKDYEDAEVLSVSFFDLIVITTEVLKAQNIDGYAHFAVCYSHAIKILMFAGRGGSGLAKADIKAAKADIEKAKLWLQMLDPCFRTSGISGLGGHLARIQKDFTCVVGESAHCFATRHHLPWFYDLVVTRLTLLDADDIEKKLQKISILEQKLGHYEYLVDVRGFEFDLCTHTYTCDCSTQFERDKAVSLLASFDVMDVTSVFQSESKTWLVMGSYKDE